MRTIIFLNTQKSGSSRDAIKIAEQLGFFTILLTDREKFLQQRTEFPDIHQMIFVDLTNIELIRMIIRKQQELGRYIEAIVSFTDPYVYLATKLNDEFCIGRFSTEAIRKMEDKILTREFLQDLPYTPFYLTYNGLDSTSTFVEQIKHPFPLMVKSPQSAGSKDVIKVENNDELTSSIHLLLSKYPEQPILIEEYLDGPQYLVETLVLDGNVHIIAIIEQEISQRQRFIITGYSVLQSLDSRLKENLQMTVETIIKAFGMLTGACHLELRLINQQWKMIEINPRISGGAMNRMVQFAYGINLVQETLKVLLGLSPDLTRKWEKNIFTQYVIISTRGILERVTGKNRAYLFPGVQEVYIKPRKGALLSAPLSMGQRYAYIIATGETSDQAKQNAKNAAKEIKFHLKPI
ncbi:MAG TPA: ATP-grasp domain-containing protein [Bacillota bacterium]|nr:ATP-grasp domain-containing protein [Bacillota bacterium]